ncbi:hypothetical protein JMJ35_006905 [Cladonia borealis]|uniref:Uncharacterized protein n=1 Tax=Cladonia borealis TaxID=184061 RepID=A0AA39QZB0_9LECA|nr:hypothetical protein JMJ35_006905 [Cladonia borealis]
MSIQSTAGYQQDYQNCMRDLDNSFSSMYETQAHDPTIAHNPSFFEPPYDNYHISSGRTNESRFDNPIDTEAWINQPMATLRASNEFYHGLSDAGVPSIRPPTIQCDPWCSAAMNRQVHSSDMLSRDHALASRAAKPLTGLSNSGNAGSARVLPIHSHEQLVDLSSAGSRPRVSVTTAAATRKLATRTKDEPPMALPDTPVKDNWLQRISWGSASVDNSYDTVHTPWNGNKTSSYSCPLIPKDNGTFLELDASGLARHGDVEQDHTLQKDLNAERWTDEYLLPVSEFPAKDDYLDGNLLGVTSPNCLNGLAYTPWNANTMSSYLYLPLPQDDGTHLGLHVSGFALHGEGEQCHTLGRGLKAEQGPSGYGMPLEYLPACRSSPRRKRRRFTNGEKAVISYKRKIGVCGDCRQAKRKASIVMTRAFFC